MMFSTIAAADARRRAILLSAIRRDLDRLGFLEVTTPVVLRVNSDSPAPTQPFIFDGIAYDLRNSIELLLRTALPVASRVYDIGPVIRFDDRLKGTKSAVEFTLLELFVAGIKYDDLMDLAEELLRNAAPSGIPRARRINVANWFAQAYGINFGTLRTDELRSALNLVSGGTDNEKPIWGLINGIIERYLEPTISGFAFLTDYPIETLCLANRKAEAPHIAERFEIYLNGLEIGHGFVDAIDPDDVLTRMMENGPQFTDRAFVERLRSGGLPTSGGFGVGIERLLAATDSGASDVRRYLHAYQHG